MLPPPPGRGDLGLQECVVDMCRAPLINVFSGHCVLSILLLPDGVWGQVGIQSGA